MTEIVIRADATRESGSGHVRRCLTLARVLSGLGWEILLATRPESRSVVPELDTAGIPIAELRGPLQDEVRELQSVRSGGPDVLLIDHYERGLKFERACRGWAGRIAVLDDLPTRPHDADLLIDMTHGRLPKDYAALLPAGATCLTGTDYALLRREFADRRSGALQARAKREGIRRVLVSVGAVDQTGIVPSVLRGLADAGFDSEVDVIGQGISDEHGFPFELRITGHATDMAERMIAADLAIGACGVTSWERCCLGLPTLAIVTAENQRAIAAALHRAGAAELIDPVTPSAIADAYSRLRGDRDAFVRMRENAAAVCDGSGASRLADAFDRLVAMHRPKEMQA